jgi:hypothetical protein
MMIMLVIDILKPVLAFDQLQVTPAASKSSTCATFRCSRRHHPKNLVDEAGSGNGW